jgi:hypothetical protein
VRLCAVLPAFWVSLTLSLSLSLCYSLIHSLTHSLSLSLRVAVKRCTKEEAAANFLREVKTMQQLGADNICKNIVRFYGFMPTVRERKKKKQSVPCAVAAVA